MDVLTVTQINDVHIQRDKETYIGSVHLTQCVLLFRFNSEELWLPYPIIHTIQRLPQNPLTNRYPLHIRCRDFMNLILEMWQDKDALALFEDVQKLTCVDSINKLYAFYYVPENEFTSNIGWNIYDLKKESERMCIWSRSKLWRISDINKTYEFCPTYPKNFIVPSKISDVVLGYAVKYRSKGRIPVLSYMHWNNMATISRSAQPLTGLKQARSQQDEKLIEYIFSSNVDVVPGQVVYGSTPTNMIVDARPVANAVGQTVTGAGTENMDNYKNCKKVFMGIENIHVMRESLARLCEAMQYIDGNNEKAGTGLNRLGLIKSGWLKHISAILDGSVMVVKNVHVFNSHVLVHCSDGWDRTAQVTSISELCLDPYYRTLVGFMVLVEKEWISFGHKFTDRCGHLSNEKYFVNLVSGGGAQKFYKSNNHARETSPVFHQFLDCVYQIQRQHPERFEFNEQFLIELHYHVYSCKFGTFLYNNECERIKDQVDTRTQSIWDYFLTFKEKYIYEGYNPELNEDRKDRGVLMPDFKNVVFWARLFRRKEEELNEGWPQELVYGTGLGILIEKFEEKEKESDSIEGSGVVVYRNGDSSSSERDPNISFINNGAKMLDINSSQGSTVVNYEIEDPWRNDDPLSASTTPLPVPGTSSLKPALDFSFSAGSSFVNRFISSYTRSKSSLSTNSTNGEKELGTIETSGSFDESSKSGIPRQYLGNTTVLRSASVMSDNSDPLTGSTGEKDGISSLARRSTSPSLTDLPRSSPFSPHRLTSPSVMMDLAVTPISTPPIMTNEKPTEIGVQVPSRPVKELPHPLHIDGED